MQERYLAQIMHHTNRLLRLMIWYAIVQHFEVYILLKESNILKYMYYLRNQTFEAPS